MVARKQKQPTVITVETVEELEAVDLESNEHAIIKIADLQELTDLTTLTAMWARLKAHGMKVELIDQEWLTPKTLDYLLHLRRKQKSKRVSAGMTASGKQLGRPDKREQTEQAVAAYRRGDGTVAQMAKQYGISQSSMFRLMREQ